MKWFDEMESSDKVTVVFWCCAAVLGTVIAICVSVFHTVKAVYAPGS